MAVMKMVFESCNMAGRKIELYREDLDTITVSATSEGTLVFYDRLDGNQVRDLIHYLTTELDRIDE